MMITFAQVELVAEIKSWAKVVKADIGQQQGLAEEDKHDRLMKIEDGLRSLDHFITETYHPSLTSKQKYSAESLLMHPSSATSHNRKMQPNLLSRHFCRPRCGEWMRNRMMAQASRCCMHPS